MNSLTQRLNTCSHLSTELACLSNKQLIGSLVNAKPMHTGIGGTSALLNINNTPIFVKKLPLTDLEKRHDNIMSTANLFNLPLFYQYGIGSTGFGAWRELAAHVMASNWVNAGEYPAFPLMYHWRILPALQENLDVSYWGNLDSYVKYWEESNSIRNRIQAIQAATTHIVLFLEWFPHNLQEWLTSKINQAGGWEAIQFVEDNLQRATSFMKAQGFIHFDAHFKNILTDGTSLYFSDFGLALSSKFDLGRKETEFLHNHHNYDSCSVAVNFLHCIITSLFGKEQWEIKLQEYL